jgi:hypothetical protein
LPDDKLAGDLGDVIEATRTLRDIVWARPAQSAQRLSEVALRSSSNLSEGFPPWGVTPYHTGQPHITTSLRESAVVQHSKIACSKVEMGHFHPSPSKRAHAMSPLLTR